MTSNQHATAAQILESWDKTQMIFRKTSAWVLMLRIAAAGPKGVTISQLHEQHFNVPDRRLLRKYAAAGLLNIVENNAHHGSRASLYCRYVITDKACHLLRIQAPQKASILNH